MGERKQEVTVNKHNISFWAKESILKWIVMKVTQFCDYTVSLPRIFFLQIFAPHLRSLLKQGELFLNTPLKLALHPAGPSLLIYFL